MKTKDETVNLIKLIQKRKKEHISIRDPDGFPDCPVEDQLRMRVAQKKEWLGTEEERQEALKSQKDMDKKIGCDFCDLCDELIGILKRVKK